MSASELLAELRECGVELVVAEGQLRYRPREAVTPKLLHHLREHKPELVKILGSERCKLEETERHSDGPSGPEARRLEAAGWKPKVRSGKVIWASPQRGFWYSQEMALQLLGLNEGLPGEHDMKAKEGKCR